MLVQFNHGAASWPTFTEFLRYRRRIAALVGLDLDRMEGFGGAREWSTVEDDLRPFLSMADVTGFVRATDCARVAHRLRRLAELIPVDLPDHERTLGLADALLAAAQAGRALRFVPRAAPTSHAQHVTAVAHALVGCISPPDEG